MASSLSPLKLYAQRHSRLRPEVGFALSHSRKKLGAMIMMNNKVRLEKKSISSW